MGKASKVKVELVEAKDLVDLIQVLKDVADMKYHAMLTQKGKFNRFSESFGEFFNLMQFSEVKHPLVANDNPVTVIVVVTTEQGFVGDLNSKVMARTLEEIEKHPNGIMVVVGKRGIMKFEQMGLKSEKSYEEIEAKGLYETAIELKDYLVDLVMSNKVGRVVAIHPWPKDYTLIKPRLVKLLPCGEVLPQKQTIEQFQQVLEESDPIDMTGYLANLWITSKLYEVFYDTNMAAAAAQTQQLDSSLGKIKKERDLVKLRWRKARKNDIDKSLREVFSARMMTLKK